MDITPVAHPFAQQWTVVGFSWATVNSDALNISFPPLLPSLGKMEPGAEGRQIPWAGGATLRKVASLTCLSRMLMALGGILKWGPSQN